MITGTVDRNGDAIIRITLRGPRGAKLELETVIDTGFNDWLTLPRQVVQSLQLPLRGESKYTLGDGSTALSYVFIAEIESFGQWRAVHAIEMDGGPLLG